MKHLFTLKSLLLTLVMLCGLNAWGETYQHVFTSKPSTGNNVTLSGMSWNIAAKSLNGYQKDYAGVQIGAKTTAGSITLTSSSDWDFNGLTEITEVRLWLNTGGTNNVTPSVKIGGVVVASDGTVVAKNSSASTWADATKVTFKPLEALSGVIEIKVATNGNKAGYICAVEIDCQAGAAAAVEKPVISASPADYVTAYLTTTTATATITAADAIKYAITDGAEPAEWTEYRAVVSIKSDVPATKTLWAKAVKGDKESAVVKQEFKFEASIANKQENAYTTEQARALIDATSSEQLAAVQVYVKGVISKIDSYNSKYKSITYWLDNNTFEVYSGKGLDNADFAAETDIEPFASVIVFGNIKKYKSTYEFDKNNYLVKYTAPGVTLESLAISGTPSKTSYAEGETFNPAGLTVTGTYSDGSTADVTSSVVWTFEPETLALGTTQVVATATYDGQTASTTVDVTVHETIEYELVVDESQIVPGRKYVIACTGATKKAVMSAISDDYFASINTNVSYADNNNKLTFIEGDAVYVTFEKAADSFANGHAKDKATTIWNVKIGDKYITSTSKTTMAMSATAPNNITMSIDKGNFVLKFGVNFFSYNPSATRFTTYDSQGTATSMAIQLFREPEAMASVMDATAETAVKLPVSVVGRKVFGNYLLASTVNNGGAQLESPSLEEAKHFWSNDPEKFNQESWIAIEGLDDSYVGKEFEVGQTLTAAGAAATYGFPTYTVAALSELDYYAGELAINNYSASNFNISGKDEAVTNVWLVAPQLGEYCQIHGYVGLADGTVAFVQANEESNNLYATVYLNGLSEFTTPGWYNIEGVVAKDGEGLAIYATAVDTATGVEGVETSSVKVYGAEGVINVESEEVAPIAVYSANGAIVSSVEASSASIAVAPGFYIVKAGNSVSKVTVK